MKTKIVWEDQAVIVCYKPAGIAVQTGRLGQQDVVSELKNYRKQKEPGSAPYIGVVHRLDQPVEGLVVFAKNQTAAGFLSAQIGDGRMKKKYLAVLTGRPGERQGTLVDYLWKDGGSNLSKVVAAGTKGAKRAELSYRLLAVKEELLLAGQQPETYSLAEILLKTGRHHQIRVQMAHMGNPLAGDNKYGKQNSQIKELALCACELSFIHPMDRKEKEFCIAPETKIFQVF